MNDYVPKRGLRNGHVMTVYCWARRRTFPRLPPPTVAAFRRRAGHAGARALPLAAATRRAHPRCSRCTGSKDRAARTTCAGSPTRRSRAASTSILLNQRNCGGTEHLAGGLYHSGLTADAAHVIGEIGRATASTAIVVAGYSLGGNLALKLAGDYGDAPPAGAARRLRRVAGPSSSRECVRALERRQNFVYQWNFVRGLKARMRRKALPSGAVPGRRGWPTSAPSASSTRSTPRRTSASTAPTTTTIAPAPCASSTASACRRSSSPRRTIRSCRPRPSAIRGSPATRTSRCVSRRTAATADSSRPAVADDDGYWAEQQIVDFAEQQCACWRRVSTRIRSSGLLGCWLEVPEPARP